MPLQRDPVVIQGGMGVAVSDWRLARAVSLTGQLGVVSGTALDIVLARRLQLGDLGGHMRRALEAFPLPDVAQRLVNRFFVPGGKSPDEPYSPMRVLSADPAREHLQRVVAANFVEVHLAKQGHSGLVGINYLEKIQRPTLPSLYGAMLAGVDYVLMGAGIPRSIPGVLDQLSAGQTAELPLHVDGATREDRFVTRFCPAAFFHDGAPLLKRPRFLAIVASTTLANMLSRKSNGRVDGFVVEGPTAGGHNAPPRGESRRNEDGEPIYGERDVVDLDAIRSLKRPFWLAGSHGSPEALAAARAAGAAGIQVGTAFAFCKESGLSDDLKQRVLAASLSDELQVRTDADASPTGFPFKVLSLTDTLSDPNVHRQRNRVCDLGFLSQGYRKEDGSLGWRCSGEPASSYLAKGGDVSDTVGRKCLCNALVANVGLAQVRQDYGEERPLLTCGDDVTSIARCQRAAGAQEYSARDVVEYLLASVTAPLPVG